MKYVCVAMLMMLVGCNRMQGLSSAPVAKEDPAEETLILMVDELSAMRKDQEIIKGRLLGKEFRGLAMGVPIGNGVLRITIPTDDEGGEVYSPSQIRDAWLQEADRLRKEPSSGSESIPTAPLPWN